LSRTSQHSLLIQSHYCGTKRAPDPSEATVEISQRNASQFALARNRQLTPLPVQPAALAPPAISDALVPLALDDDGRLASADHRRGDRRDAAHRRNRAIDAACMQAMLTSIAVFLASSHSPRQAEAWREHRPHLQPCHVLRVSARLLLSSGMPTRRHG
jgi:hypothetical protein